MKWSLLLYNLKLNCLIFYQSKQLTDYIYADIYCKLSKCIGQTRVCVIIILFLIISVKLDLRRAHKLIHLCTALYDGVNKPLLRRSFL